MVIAFLITASSLLAQVTDQDGNSYNTVVIGTQIWMAKNLNVNHFRNGDPIPEKEDAAGWRQAAKDGTPAWCYYNTDPVDGRGYGKLYNWYAVSDPRGIAPDGWHIASGSDWAALADSLGDENIAGLKMKATDSWDNNGNGTNESGFSGLPCGSRFTDGAFYNFGQYGYWWSTSESSDLNAWYRFLYCDDGFIGKYDDAKGCGFSVRCVRN
jgi:uncharacterized protein (TIGR02145 family)